MIMLPNVKPYMHVLKPPPPTQDTLPIYIALRAGMKRFGNQSFTCTVPPEHTRDTAVLHMSSLGQCARKQWFQLHCPDACEPEENKGHPYLYLGNVIEAYALQLLALGGLPPFDMQREVIDLERNMTGHIDALVQIGGASSLLEIKGLHHKSVEHLILYGVQKAIPTYYDQMLMYMFCLELSSGFLIALDKDTSEWYIECVKMNNERVQFLREKAWVICDEEDFRDIPEQFVVRDCLWCPLIDRCMQMEGHETFIKNYVKHQETRP